MPSYFSPQADAKDMMAAALGASVQAAYAVTGKITLGAELSMFKSDVKDSFIQSALDQDSPGETILHNDSSVSFTNLGAFVKYYFSEEGWRPYAHFGVGSYASKSKIDVASSPSLPEPGYQSEDKMSDTGVNLGFGVRKDLSESVFGLFDLRYHRIFSEDDDNGDSFEPSFIAVSVGAGFRF